jgi:hypothetical protein
MDTKPAIHTLFKSHYFWDVNVSALDEVKNQRLIIERIMSYGSLQEIIILLEYYGKQTVIRTCLGLASLDPKTLNFLSALFDLPKENFRCHTGKPLKYKHWNS